MSSGALNDNSNKAIPQTDPQKSDINRVDLPVGDQVVNISASMTSHLKTLTPQQIPFLLDATQVWIGKKNGKLILHLGDIEPGALID